jgi:hypothetical protein
MQKTNFETKPKVALDTKQNLGFKVLFEIKNKTTLMRTI